MELWSISTWGYGLLLGWGVSCEISFIQMDDVCYDQEEEKGGMVASV